MTFNEKYFKRESGQGLAVGLPNIKLPWTNNPSLGVRHHLLPVSDPARHTPHSEEDGEHRGGKAQRPENYAGVEINIWCRAFLRNLSLACSDI